MGCRAPDGAEWDNRNGIAVILVVQKCIHVFLSLNGGSLTSYKCAAVFLGRENIHDIA
jgi:hypothetical protein